MVLIIGGAYQGMLEYALEKTHYRSTDVYNCTRDKVDIDFSKRILNNVEEICYACLEADRNPVKFMAARRSKWANSVIILNDISCGLVPMDPKDRAAREAASRLAIYLVGEADAVIRVFAGIGKRIK
ncbi:MAG: bifunctional adenosylcobinamide kinase/adenosylcobinamide-phosphate guanylyltransferase [Clostridia bacterium]|jgi:adenosylcobinamide kinase/adenosylcobinamide-phosphate guanylyltransferase|nr:bifunctional adenosylcobinamide kinase/adenosylcobinamide-phosphate guanylyltransferase [Clostridia bacterium]